MAPQAELSLQNPVHDLEILRNHIREGRFQRSLSLLTAFASLMSGLEVSYEHYRGSYSQRVMYTPVILSAALTCAGVAGFFSRRMAKTALPLASAIIVANGVQGVYLHARGIHQKPGGFKNFRYNMEMGPPLMAPLLVTLVGGMGLIAAVLRREK